MKKLIIFWLLKSLTEEERIEIFEMFLKGQHIHLHRDPKKKVKVIK